MSEDGCCGENIDRYFGNEKGNYRYVSKDRNNSKYMIIDSDVSKQLTYQNVVSGKLRAPSISLQRYDNTFSNLMANSNPLLRSLTVADKNAKYTYIHVSCFIPY